MKQILIAFSILLFAIFTTGAEAQPKAASAQQKLCYEQAEKVTKELAMDGWTTDWTSHYNLKTNICYVRALESKVDDDGNLFVRILIKDAFQNDEVGFFFSREKAGLKKVFVCRVEGDKCGNEDEFFRRTRSIWQD